MESSRSTFGRAATLYATAVAASAAALWPARRFWTGYLPDGLLDVWGIATLLAALLALALGLVAVVLAGRRGVVPLLAATLALSLGVAAVRALDDPALMRRFAGHRADFARLGALLAEEGAGRVAGRRAVQLSPRGDPQSPPDSAGRVPDPARRAAYRALFARLGLPEGAYPATNFVHGSDPALGDATLTPVFLEGFLGKYHQAGYAYAPGAAGPAFAAWVRAHQRDCAPLVLRHLEGDWYVYRYFNCPSVRTGA